MFDINNILSALAGLLILDKVVILVCNLDRKDWIGNKVRFALLSISLGTIIAGAAGVVFSCTWGGYALLYGVAGKFFFDRRLLELKRKVIL